MVVKATQPGCDGRSKRRPCERPTTRYKERHVGTGLGLTICFATMPAAVVMTIVLMPLWSWLEMTIAIEAVRHSGPAEWCYLFMYLLVVSIAEVLCSLLRRQRQQEKR